MKFLLHLSPTETADLTDYIPQDGISQLQVDLYPPRASLELDVFAPNPTEGLRKALRSPGILEIQNDYGIPIYFLHYNPVRLKYDPTKRRYTLSFTSILEALKTYVDKERWFNVLDAATLLGSLNSFLSQYLPSDKLADILSDSMSPFPENVYPDLHLTGFVQPASWLVGKKVDCDNPNAPFRIINVLGAAYDGSGYGYFLTLAKPAVWTSEWGDFVFPVIVKAQWYSQTFDWEPVDAFAVYGDADPDNNWVYPLHFGRELTELAGITGESAVIDCSPDGYVVVAWLEYRDSAGENPYGLEPRIRIALLDGNLTLIDQKLVYQAAWKVGDLAPYLPGSPTTVLFRHSSEPGNNRGVLFIGINANLRKEESVVGGGFDNYSLHGQDGVWGIYHVRWDATGIQDVSSGYLTGMVDAFGWVVSDGGAPQRLLDFRVRFDGTYHRIDVLRASTVSGLEDVIFFPAVSFTHYAFHYTNGVSTTLGATKVLQFATPDEYPWPAVVFGCPIDREISKTSAGYAVVGYTLIDPKGNVKGLWLKHVAFPLDGTSSDLTVDPEADPFVELDVELKEGQDRLFNDPYPSGTDAQREQARRAYLRTLLTCRLRPVAYEFDEVNTEARFLILHQGKSAWEAFTVAANRNGLLDLKGAALGSELIGKVAGGTYNEAEVWRPVVFEAEKRGRYSLASIPLVKQVCEMNWVYSEPGKVGYKNLMNPDTRYKYAVYNAHRLHLVSRDPYWSFVEDSLDYREKTNLDLLEKSWEGACLGAQIVVAKNKFGEYVPAVLFHPRFPLRGLTQTISGDNYWEGSSGAVADYAVERGFKVELFSRYWDAVVLGPQGGAILTNIWWDEEGHFNRELVVKVKELSPAWFGLVQERARRYNDLFSGWSSGGTRWGMRAFSLPIYMDGYVSQLEPGKIYLIDLNMESLRDDPELGELPTDPSSGQPVPSYWQVLGYRVDLAKRVVLMKFGEVISV